MSADNKTMSTSTTKDNQKKPVACKEVPAAGGSSYPAPFLHAVKGRSKHKLGDFFGLQNFGINYTTLAPGASSALQHHHAKQDEFVVVLEGTATLHLGEKKHLMQSGDCMGFPAGQGVGHCVVNESTSNSVVYLEVGDRTADDEVDYPNDDLRAVPDGEGKWQFTHKDGTPYG